MKILLVEDDRDLSATVSRALSAQGYSSDCCFDGEEAFEYAVSYDYDLIILDRMLPKKDGVSVLKEIRQKGINVPVIIVTAMNRLGDRIDGLDAGADDYLVKPFAPEELFARIRALLRRPKRLEEQGGLNVGNLTLLFSEYTLKSDSESVTLSKKETALLEFFMTNVGQTLTREQIILRVWGAEAAVNDGNLDNYIFFLRRRLKAVKSTAEIVTVHGMGYRLTESGEK